MEERVRVGSRKVRVRLTLQITVKVEEWVRVMTEGRVGSRKGLG